MGTGTGALINEAFSKGHVLLPLNFFSTHHLVKKKKCHLFPHYFVVIDHTFYGFSGVTTHVGCWENARRACKSGAKGEWLTGYCFPTSHVGYHAGKPLERVVYCFYKITLSKTESYSRQKKWCQMPDSIKFKCTLKTAGMQPYLNPMLQAEDRNRWNSVTFEAK